MCVFLCNPNPSFAYVFLSVKYRKSEVVMIRNSSFIAWTSHFLPILWLLFLTCFISLYFAMGWNSTLWKLLTWEPTCHLLFTRNVKWMMWQFWGSVSSPVHWEHNACMTNPILIVIPPYLKIDDPGNQSSYWMWTTYALGKIKIQSVISDNPEY